MTALFRCALPALILTAGLLAPSAEAQAKDAKGKAGASAVTLNGVRVDVRWSDGDSFKIKDGRFKGVGTRLRGYNTLESFGPVHQWGTFTGEELYTQAKDAKYEANSQVWDCTTDPNDRDHYGRLLVTCPKLIEHMVAVGAAHLFAIDETPDPKAVAAQLAAIKAKKGIWAKGVPKMLLTSLHSLDEQDWKEAYNRAADPLTGKAVKILHKETYTECQQVCMEGSCMLFVPFKRRYGRDRAPCLKWGKGAKPPTEIKPSTKAPPKAPK